MYFAPIVCNLFKGIQNKCIFFGIYMYDEKMYAKEFGNLLEYIALGNQCKNVKKDVLNSIQRNIGAECFLFCVFHKFI